MNLASLGLTQDSGFFPNTIKQIKSVINCSCFKFISTQYKGGKGYKPNPKQTKLKAQRYRNKTKKNKTDRYAKIEIIEGEIKRW